MMTTTPKRLQLFVWVLVIYGVLRVLRILKEDNDKTVSSADIIISGGGEGDNALWLPTMGTTTNTTTANFTSIFVAVKGSKNNNFTTSNNATETEKKKKKTREETYDDNHMLSSPPSSLPPSVSSSSSSSNLRRSFDLALRRTTELIYKDCGSEERNYWLSQPPPIIYIYNNLPPDWSDVSNISTCIDRHFETVNNDIGDEGGSSKNNMEDNTCLWYPKLCTDGQQESSTNGTSQSKQKRLSLARRKKQSLYQNYRNNFNSDVSYLLRFQTAYPSEYRTTDPTKADLFVVPYPHESHCLCHKDFRPGKPKCAGISRESIQQHVLDKLIYFNMDHMNDTKVINRTAYLSQRSSLTASDRHLFLYGSDRGHRQVRYLVRAAEPSFTLSLGPVDTDSNTGDMTTPYTTTSAELQPNVVASVHHLRPESWWTADRPYALGAAFGQSRSLPERNQFIKTWTKAIGHEISGKPNAIHSLGGTARDATSVDFMQLYRNSTFCLILPGDECPQKRFFDAILNGCIPVVKLLGGTTDTPRFVRGNCIVSYTYPFSQGSILGRTSSNNSTIRAATKAGIDMFDIVLTYNDNGECDLDDGNGANKFNFECMKAPMERLLSNKTALREHQLRLRDYAMLLGFGLTEESYEYPDAFMATIVSLRHKLWDRMGKIPKKLLEELY